MASQLFSRQSLHECFSWTECEPFERQSQPENHLHPAQRTVSMGEENGRISQDIKMETKEYVVSKPN